MCKVCEAGYIGWLMTKRVKSKEMTITEFCDYFGITKKEAYEHLERHQMPDPMDNISEGEDYYQRLRAILESLDKIITKSLSNPKVNLQALTALIREYRTTMMALADIKKKMAESEKILEVEQYNKKLDQLVTAITEVLCPACRAKVIEVLHDLEESD